MKQRPAADELELLARFRELLPPAPRDLVIGPGDDCAAIEIGEDRLLLLTCDVLVEDRHFSRDYLGPRALGRRLAAVNLSDVAAMGGRATYGLLSLVLPDDATDWAEETVRGVSEALGEHGAYLVGGNLSGTGGGIAADLTLIGEVERGRVLRRSGARRGDSILVTGHLGSSAAGLRLLTAGRSPSAEEEPIVEAHTAPRPRIEEGRAIADSGLATSMIDLSDGLTTDLERVCTESRVGAEVDLAALPVLEATRRLCRELSLAWPEIVLGGGEDYELLLTCPEHGVEEVKRRVENASGTLLTAIGRITDSASGIRYLDASGKVRTGPPRGWDHFAR